MTLLANNNHTQRSAVAARRVRRARRRPDGFMSV